MRVDTETARAAGNVASIQAEVVRLRNDNQSLRVRLKAAEKNLEEARRIIASHENKQ